MNFFPIRKTDVGLILTVIMLLGAVWAGYSKPAAWDQCVKDVVIMKPIVSDDHTQMAVMKQTENDHFEAIMLELHAINKKVGR